MLWLLESKDLQSEVVVDVPCQRNGTCMSVVILQVILSNCIYLFCPILEILSFLIIFLLDSVSSFYRQCNHKIKKTSIRNVWLGLDSWETLGSRLYKVASCGTALVSSVEELTFWPVWLAKRSSEGVVCRQNALSVKFDCTFIKSSFQLKEKQHPPDGRRNWDRWARF